mgnify:CR=1 FL=1
MTMTRTQIEIETILRRLGARGTQKGFWCMCSGVELALNDPTLLYAVTKELYPAIARLHGVHPQAMIRDLRSLVEICWNEGDHELLQQVAQRRLTGKPSVGEFIDFLSGYLRRLGL